MSLSEIQSSKHRVVVNGDFDFPVVLPFVNQKYRANVRVVDFFPDRLEDFAVGRRRSEYDILSDYSGGESTDNEEDMRTFRKGKGFGGEKVWSWRFALLVEDLAEDHELVGKRPYIWLNVDNQAAQGLLDMDAKRYASGDVHNHLIAADFPKPAAGQRDSEHAARETLHRVG